MTAPVNVEGPRRDRLRAALALIRAGAARDTEGSFALIDGLVAEGQAEELLGTLIGLVIAEIQGWLGDDPEDLLAYLDSRLEHLRWAPDSGLFGEPDVPEDKA